MSKISPTLKVIKAEMDREKIGMHEMAAHIGVAASTLYRIFDGTFIPNFQTVEDLLKALKMKITVKR